MKKGGGNQTKSLRLENKEGKQWVLRSIEKDPSKAIPEAVRIKLAVDLARPNSFVRPSLRDLAACILPCWTAVLSESNSASSPTP